MISMTLLGILGLLCLFALLALRMPVALSMLFVGFVGTIIANANKFILVGMDADQAWARGLKIAYSNLSGEAFEAASNYNLLVIPMFVLMGNLAGVSGMSNDLFTAAYRWMGHLRGGLATATIAACAGFAALSLWIIFAGLMYLTEYQDSFNALDDPVPLYGCDADCTMMDRFQNFFDSMIYTGVHLTGDYPITTYTWPARFVNFFMVRSFFHVCSILNYFLTSDSTGYCRCWCSQCS